MPWAAEEQTLLRAAEVGLGPRRASLEHVCPSSKGERVIFPEQNLSFPALHPPHKSMFVFILILCMLENDSCCYYFELVLWFSEQMWLSYLASVPWVLFLFCFRV